VLAELGLPSITTEVATKDWDAATTQEQVLTTAASAGPGDIVLMHTWPEKTVQAMPEIIAQLRAKGLRFVTVSELLALAPSAEGRSAISNPRSL
jgi:peptidoglycan/xylan/chitin deacetylase (PgdA/CDA1 family)